jgi:hypothetical protein
MEGIRTMGAWIWVILLATVLHATGFEVRVADNSMTNVAAGASVINMSCSFFST